MIKFTHKFIVVIFLLAGVFSFSQDKKNFSGIQNIMQNITPNQNIEFWTLVYNNYGKDEVLVKSDGKKEYLPQSSGFDIFPNEDSFYYIAYSQGGKMSYITDLQNLKSFIGKIDNVEEAAIAAAIDGYFIDEEFKHLAGNYYSDTSYYYLDLGKLTSTECPYQKKYFTLTVSKSNGNIIDIKDNGPYIELYNKKCTNNPRLLKIEKKAEPKDEPKKSTRSTKRR